jgi:hypothetical protein
MPFPRLLILKGPYIGRLADIRQQGGARLAMALPAPHGGNHVRKKPPIIPPNHPPRRHGGPAGASVAANMNRPVFQIAKREADGLLYSERRVNKARGEPGVESRCRNGYDRPMCNLYSMTKGPHLPTG